MPIPVEVLAGPVAALALSVYVIRELWKAHQKSDDDCRAQRDLATSGWREQTTATNRLADAIEADVRDRAIRHGTRQP